MSKSRSENQDLDDQWDLNEGWHDTPDKDPSIDTAWEEAEAEVEESKQASLRSSDVAELEIEQRVLSPIKPSDGIAVILGGESTRYIKDDVEGAFEEYRDALTQNLLSAMALVTELPAPNPVHVFLPGVAANQNDYLNKPSPVWSKLDTLALDRIYDPKGLYRPSSKKELLDDLVTSEDGGRVTKNNVTYVVHHQKNPQQIQEYISRLRAENSLTHIFVVAHGSQSGQFSLISNKEHSVPLLLETTPYDLASGLRVKKVPLLNSKDVGKIQVYMNCCHAEQYAKQKFQKEGLGGGLFKPVNDVEFLEGKHIKVLAVAAQKDELDCQDKMSALAQLLCENGVVMEKDPFYVDVEEQFKQLSLRP